MRLRLVYAVALMTALLPAPVIAQDAEQEARELLVEAIRAYQSGWGAAEVGDRVAAFETAQAALDRIEADCPPSAPMRQIEALSERRMSGSS